MHYYLIAGEASGDLHGADLIKSLKENDPDARFTFLGGDLMERAAGKAPVIHYRHMAYMGFSEVLRHLPEVFGNLRQARRVLTDDRPDLLILIDYPSFNLKVAKTAHKLGIPVNYYISPKIWAWKKWRVRTIRKLVDKVLCIFPFEPRFYADNGYDKAVYVGNPSVGEIDRILASVPSRDDVFGRYRLRTNRDLIVLMPGSRVGEIRNNLPVMDAAARLFPQYNIVVAGAPGIDDELYSGLTKFQVVRDPEHHLLAYAHAAVVTSGTATLETALTGVPQVAVYRSNGSKIAYNLMKRLLHVSYVTLPNIILDRAAIPELLLHECTPESIADCLSKLTPANSDTRRMQLEDYAELRKVLSTRNASDTAAKEIIAVHK